MTTSFDQESDAAYLSLSTERVAETVPIMDGVLMDVDASGNAVGIEVLSASTRSELIERIRTSAAAGLPLVSSGDATIFA